jgi:hypothetical protein
MTDSSYLVVVTWNDKIFFFAPVHLELALYFNKSKALEQNKENFFVQFKMEKKQKET